MQRLRACVLLSVAIAACSLTGQAFADQVGGDMPAPSPTTRPSHGPLPSAPATAVGGGTTAAGDGAVSGVGTADADPVLAPPAATLGLKTVCRSDGNTITCRYFQGTRLVKTCTRRRSQTTFRCLLARTAPAAQRAPNAGIASTQLNKGFASQPNNAVVRLSWETTKGRQSCSGTVVTQGLILTAGHCVYANPTDGKGSPEGYYDATTYQVVPGHAGNNGQPYAPFGVWSAKHVWTTADYADQSHQGHIGGDWGIIEVNPDAQGRYPGQVVGTSDFTVNAKFTTGAELYLTGYPASGLFTQAPYGGGNLQYFCDERWDQATDLRSDAAAAPGYYMMVFEPCAMNGGASGGPVYLKTQNGWTIVGVNNRGVPFTTEEDPNRYGRNMQSYWLDDKFQAFWTYVVGQVQAGS